MFYRPAERFLNGRHTRFEEKMKFGPADFMDGLKALILVMTASAIITEIILGAIVALYRNFFRDRAAHHFHHREADLSFQSGMSTALPTVPAQKIDATAPSPGSAVPRGRRLALIGIINAIATAGAGFLSYYTSTRSSFEATYNNQPRIHPSPPTIEPQQQVREATSSQPRIQPSPPTGRVRSSRCAQLSRKPTNSSAFNHCP